MPDWVPFILGLMCAGLSGLLGTYVSLAPPATRSERIGYLAAFVVLFIGGTAAAIWQNRQENAATRELAGLLQRIDTQTKQPPSVTVQLQPTTGPLPVHPLRGPGIPECFNDHEWTTVTPRPVEIQWGQMAGIDAFADLDVYSVIGDCGEAQARIFDVVANKAVVTGPRTTRCGFPYDRQLLKIPREEGTHAYVLQTVAGFLSCAAATGDLRFARQ